MVPGKSTLIEILAGRVRPDTGDVALRKRARLSSVVQVSEFARSETVRSVIEKAFHEGPRSRTRTRWTICGGSWPGGI